MATTTPNYGWAVPTSTDLVKDGATAIETLGDAIDASMNTALGTKKAGMVLLNTTSFSAVSSVSLPAGTFSATYDNYSIRFNNTVASSALWISARMRASGSDDSTSNYATQQYSASGTTVSASRNTAQNFLYEFQYIHTDRLNTPETLLVNPFNTRPTVLTASLPIADSTPAYYLRMWVQNTTTSYDSMTFYTGSATTLTGSVSVYGFNK
jgi:hypothetical protein